MGQPLKHPFQNRLEKCPVVKPLHTVPKNLAPKIPNKQVQLTFKEAVDTCIFIVRQETDNRVGLKVSQFDAYSYSEGRVEFIGTEKERFT